MNPGETDKAEKADNALEQGVWTGGKYRHALFRAIPDGSGGQMAEITLREPTTGDVIESGNPCTLDPSSNPPRVLFDERKQAAMISRLAGIPPSSVARMSPKDFTALGWIIADFFLPV
jgi:hypothetical protein